jgi:ribonuclease HI
MPFIVFADGASSGNPGPGGWGSIIASPDGHVTELGGGDRSTTNNRMELMAVIEALARLSGKPGAVEIFTDSVYVIRGATQWHWAWRRNDWKTAEGKDVSNPELWKRLLGLVAARGKENPVSWKFVRGHSGIPGNERVDEIAVSFSKGRRPRLYDGPLLKYDVAIHDVPEDTSIPEMRPREAKAPAFSYLSLLGSTPMRHSSWAECERRVKGQSGARFKKAMSEEEEERILQSWGFSRRDLK